MLSLIDVITDNSLAKVPIAVVSCQVASAKSELPEAGLMCEG